jgi:zinc protease
LTPFRRVAPAQATLANGIKVLMVENPCIPAISMNLTVLTGARDDPQGRAGTALMVSRLLEEGTATRTSLEIADAIESVGGAIETDCTYDRLSIFLDVLSRDIDLGLELVADMIQNPTFLADSIENERDRTLAEIRSAMDRPQVVAGLAFNELVYGDHALHRPVHGYPETIARIQREDLVAFHERYVSPENALLAVAGSFALDEMRDRLEAAFGPWKPGGDPALPAASGPVASRGIRSRRIEFESHQAHVYLGHLGVRRTHPDFYALQVMDAILGGSAGLTARIPRKLRDEQGLAYTTFSSITNSAGLDPGKFVAYMGTAPENVSRAVEGFIREIELVRDEGVSLQELEDARAYLTGSFVFGFETNAQLTRFLISAHLFDLGFDYIDKYPGYIEKVSAAEIRRVARAHLSTEHCVLVVAGPGDIELPAIG